MQKVFISIINFNGQADTLHCLNSLEKVKTSGFELHVVVVDNASREPFSAEPKDFHNFTLFVLPNAQNTGFSGGHNEGIAYALEHGAEYIIILNNDTLVDENLVSSLVTAADADPKIGVVAPKIYFAKGHEFHKERYREHELGKVIWYAGGEMDWQNVYGHHRGVDEVDLGQYDSMEPTAFASGCCLLLRREVCEKVGFFDERYFLYYEDSDLNMRIKKAGYTVMYQPQAMLWHKNAGSTGGSGSALHDYFISRNRLLFGFTYAPLRTKIALFRESIVLMRGGRVWQRKGIRDFFLRRFGKGSYSV